MVKLVSSENPLNNQFSEVASNAFKSPQDVDLKKGTVNSEEDASKPELTAHSDNVALRNLQKGEAEKTEEEAVAEIEQAFEEISGFMNLYNRNVNFSMDEKSEKTVIKVFDSDSKELIKQFPSEDLVKLAQKIKELRQDVDLKSGIFLDEKV
ncbi:flagellar protein FlaG [Thalassotalea piscium]